MNSAIYGERNGKAKLTDAQVEAIRSDYVPGEFGLRKVAAKHKLPYSTVRGWCKEERRINFAALRK